MFYDCFTVRKNTTECWFRKWRINPSSWCQTVICNRPVEQFSYVPGSRRPSMSTVNRSTCSSRHSMNLQSTNPINNSCHSNKTYAPHFLDCMGMPTSKTSALRRVAGKGKRASGRPLPKACNGRGDVSLREGSTATHCSPRRLNDQQEKAYTL